MFPNTTLECSLNRSDPSVEFSFTFSDISMQFNLTGMLALLQVPRSLPVDNGIFELSEALRSPRLSRELHFMDIFYNDDVIVSVTCVAKNSFGEDNATSLISVCGTTVNSNIIIQV